MGKLIAMLGALGGLKNKSLLPELWIDCTAVVADGGLRTAAPRRVCACATGGLVLARILFRGRTACSAVAVVQAHDC